MARTKRDLCHRRTHIRAAGPPSHSPPVTGQVGPGLREGTLGTSGEGQQGAAVWFGIEDPRLMVRGATQTKDNFYTISLLPLEQGQSCSIKSN